MGIRCADDIRTFRKIKIMRIIVDETGRNDSHGIGKFEWQTPSIVDSMMQSAREGAVRHLGQEIGDISEEISIEALKATVSTFLQLLVAAMALQVHGRDELILQMDSALLHLQETRRLASKLVG